MRLHVDHQGQLYHDVVFSSTYSLAVAVPVPRGGFFWPPYPSSYPLQAGMHPCLTITLTPLTGGMRIRTATGKGPSVLSLARILEEAEACDNLHPWHSVIFLPLPPLSPKALRNRLTRAC